ncbi:MAG TPA: integrase, partial [Rhodanobacteraceae bacterium]|nr:integrase [Rhodanobacteraceae bacterium]
MPRHAIDKVRVRNALEPRESREPYWGAPIGPGLFLGFRKLESGGTWIARQRAEDGGQKYHSIGHVDAVP